jgi:hypothetical protein
VCRKLDKQGWSNGCLPAFAAALGVIVLVAEWAGGHPRPGFISLAIMLVFAAAILLGGRSETVRGLRGDARDERFAALDLKATAFAGTVLIVAVIVAFLVQIARGHDGAPSDWLGAIAGMPYVVGVVVLRVRG